MLRKRQLLRLPAKLGYPDLAALIEDLQDVARLPRKAKAIAPKAAASKPRRRRAVITDQIRASVKEQVIAGKTGVEIARALKISLPTVQTIKRALGLVRKPKR